MHFSKYEAICFLMLCTGQYASIKQELFISKQNARGFNALLGTFIALVFLLKL
jgi:hypothetical protein